MRSYFLQPYVHICKANGHFVFLNLKDDEYSALDRKQSETLEHMMSSQHEVTNDQEIQKEQFLLGHMLAEELIAQGLLTSESIKGKPLAAVSVPNTTSPLIEDAQCRQLGIGLADIWHFYAACIRAHYALRTLTIEKIVLRIARRKNRHASRKKFDAKSAGRNLGKFKALRPFYHRHYSCLFDAFALIEFLAFYRLYPTWVFGIQSEPFRAHCWVQEAEYALDEDVDVVHTYTPIMSV